MRQFLRETIEHLKDIKCCRSGGKLRDKVTPLTDPGWAKDRSSAHLMMPGAPSEVINSDRSGPSMSSKNAVTVSASPVQQHATAFVAEAPGRQNGRRHAALARRCLDEQIGDLVLAQVPLHERLVLLPQPPLAELRYRGLREQQPAVLVPASSMWRTDSPRATISIARSSRPFVRPLRCSRMAEQKGSSPRPAIWAQNTS